MELIKISMLKMDFKLIIVIFVLFSGLESRAQVKSDKAVPVEKDGVVSIVVHNAKMEISPKIGGRISSIQLDGAEFMTGKDVNDLNWGSTLWPSPQSDWNWPPPAVLDSQAYSVEIEDRVLKMTSQKDPQTGLVFTKEFWGDLEAGSFTLYYTITNRGDQPRKVAPWEVTRVKTKGIAFFPYGEGERRGGLLPSTIEKDGITWFVYQEEKLPTKGDRQLYTDGSQGWLAQVNGRTLLLKKFADVPFEKNAPKEGEIELYASPVVPGKSYVEIEHQGAYEELEPGGSLNWEVTWFLRKLPDTIEVTPGNPALVKYVKEIIN